MFLQWALYYSETDDRFGMMASDADTGGANFISTPAPPIAQTGTWYHLVGQYDATDQKLTMFLNGAVPVRNIIYWTPGKRNGFIIVGTDGGSEVVVDEVALYSRLLSHQEIQTLYKNQLNSFTHEHWSEAPGLMEGNVLLLHMDEDSGDLVDYSGLGNDAAVILPATYSDTGQIG